MRGERDTGDASPVGATSLKTDHWERAGAMLEINEFEVAFEQIPVSAP